MGSGRRCLSVDGRVFPVWRCDYWKSPFYLLEAHGLDVWLVNAKDVKHLPGRPKTDRLAAVWPCKVAERQMIRPSFVPPKPIRRLRDLTRYRVGHEDLLRSNELLGTQVVPLVRQGRRPA